ncbi:MAG: hypothetical protein K6A77_04565 [Clostridiales bacterium]|nr:hypothetical protein [Clostridiales bacterium]
MKIKRASAWLIVWFLAISCLNGCGKNNETAESLLTKASENTKDAASVTLQLTMDIDMTMEDPDSEEAFEASTSFQANMDIVKEPLSMEADAMIRSAFESDVTEENAAIYAVPAEEEGKIVLYTGSAMEEEGLFWYKETVESETLSTIEHNADLPTIFAETKDITFELRKKTETIEDQQKVYVLDGKVTGETLKKLVGAMDFMGDVLGVGEDSRILTSEATVVYRIDQETRMPVDAVIDLTEVVKPLMVDYGIEIKKTELNVVFSRFDTKQEIQVPEDALQNAFDLEDMSGDINGEDMTVELDDEGEEDMQEDVLVDTEDTAESLKETSLEEPGAMNEWISAYALAADGQYYQIGFRITGLQRGDATKDAVESYLQENEEPVFSETLNDKLEYATVEYEVYIPTDFPDPEFAGIEMYIIGEDGAYLSSDEYEFTDMFWIVPVNFDEVTIGPGQYGKGLGLCTLEKDLSTFCVEVGDSWYHEGYIRVS